ncbi:MAG: hypothetical protein AAFX06_18455 [Planctomycetota bacterium]
MLEIFALPYFVISGVIGWAIFAPFLRTDDSESLTCAKVTISDLLAMSLPVCVLVLSASWFMPSSIQSTLVQAIVLAIALLFAVSGVAASLYLVPKTFRVSFVKRMTLVGLIAPFGIVLTVGWIGFPVWACLQSISYLAPSMVGIGGATMGLRVLSLWVCRTASTDG